MEKYATYDYFKNKETGEVKKVALHNEVEVEKNIEKLGSLNNWIKVTNDEEVEKLEKQK